MAMPISADQVRSLHPFELRILLALEHRMHRYEWVPLDLLRSATGLSEGELGFRLGRLIAADMVRYHKAPYEGYMLVFQGFDTLALHSLTERSTVKALGQLVGVGKESVVYEGLGLSPLILKFHRIGERSFQSARLDRGYLPGEPHLPRIFASAYSAEREFAALRTLHPEVHVPLPIDRSRHVVVMSLVQGALLNRIPLTDPERTLREILEHVRRAYRKGVIHADLSEFNVMMEDHTPILIDWPQWVSTDHPNAIAILERDLENLLTYFQRKYRIAMDRTEVLREVCA